MATDRSWDVIIVGAGIIGTWTGYHLVKSGQRVLILDQFHLPHTRGSTHGHSRLIRKAYQKELYGNMMSESFDMWMKLQNETDVQFFIQTGMLSVEDQDQKMNKKYAKILDENQIEYKLFNSQEIQNKYPMLNFPSNHKAIFDPSAGLVNPVKVTEILYRKIQEEGGVIRDLEQVLKIQPGTSVTITTNKATYNTRSVVLVPGPWAQDVLNLVGIKLPVKSMAGWPAYWPVTGEYNMQATNGLPIIKYDTKVKDGYRFILMMPEWEYQGMVKIVSRGEPVPQYVHPDRQARDEYQVTIINMMKEYIKNHMKGVENKPSLIEGCMYTLSPDGAFIIDKHPQYDNVTFAVGFTGAGFIAAPIAGKLLSELVTKTRLSYDISGLGLNRFKEDISTIGSKL